MSRVLQPRNLCRAFKAAEYANRVFSPLVLIYLSPHSKKSSAKDSPVRVSFIWETTQSTSLLSRSNGDRSFTAFLIRLMSSSDLLRIVADLILRDLVRSLVVQTRVVGNLRDTPLNVTLILTGYVPSFRLLLEMTMALNVIIWTKISFWTNI